MAQRTGHTAFDTSHPAVPAVYLAVTLGLTMGAIQPVLIGISLLGVLIYMWCSRGVARGLAALRWQLPLIALICLVNPVFSASGSTEVARVGERAIYLESLCYGLAMGGLFVASALWFQVAADLLGFDKVMALFGNVAPVVALMISMCMRLIPRFLRQGRLILAVQDAVHVPGRGVADSMRRRLRASSALMDWVMTDSLETADAMRARGWGAGMRRTTYTRYRFTAADAVAVTVVSVMGTLCCVLAWAATSQYSFYPTLSRLTVWWGYVPYAAWMLVPTVLHLRERSLFP